MTDAQSKNQQEGTGTSSGDTEKGKEKGKQAEKEGGSGHLNRRLPGFNLPLNFYEKNMRLTNARLDACHQQYFPSALNPVDIMSFRSTQPLLTLRELSMLRIMNELTEKPNWEEKIFNPEIIAKWKSEMVSTPITPSISSQMAEYIIAELQYTAQCYKHTGHINTFNVVVKSDTALPVSFMEELQTAMRPLEDVPEHLKDWHPGSDGKVLDLVHPSLFPLVYGKTRILNFPDHVPLLEATSYTGKGTALPIPSILDLNSESTWVDDPASPFTNRRPYSTKFQWLPCEVSFLPPTSSSSVSTSASLSPSTNDLKPKIVSYINNLHPVQHADVYKLVEMVIDAALPMWDKTLQRVLENIRRIPMRRTRIDYNGMYVSEIIQPEPGVFVPPSPLPKTATGEGPSSTPSATGVDGGKADHPEAVDEGQTGAGSSKGKESTTKKDKKPHKPKKDRSPPPIIVNLRKKFKKQGLQVIVKFANIELTPEKPSYDGGSWHLEGQLNENICASALYYYSSHNITTSTLAFRQQSDTSPTNIIAMPDGFLPAIYGGTENNSGVQTLGGVSTPQGRLLVFPNVLQHQVQPFSLADPTQRGWRKILALFLVDPNTRIISTRHVPPQRRDWWAKEMKVGSVRGLGALPVEIQEEVFDEMEFPIGMKEAKELREELMSERKDFEVQYDKSFNSVSFSLCEH
ncbi:hypothetical protein BJ165DRAFT_1407316 [Panaeolus papilionaceus]|nr:hypothetical protein BJ165DRAFT_1407316 [Panaeolus papilionaceus]